MAYTVTLQPVGVVRSNVTEIDDERDWSDVESEIVVDDALAAGLQGVDAFAQVVVVFYLHKFTFDPATELLQRLPTRDDPVGIFALRTNQLPNAIGATTVRLLGVEGRVLRVKGLDALDGSPVLDIKPPAPPVIRPPAPLPDREPEI